MPPERPAPKKRLGQHFLSDTRILDRIAAALDPAPGEAVLEIGPGPGGLTRALLARTGQLVVIEKDRDLAAALAVQFPNLHVVEGDALALDWHSLVAPPFSIAGNIPYNITSPLIDKALEPPRPRRIVYLVQKEVAERVAAPPGGKEYGALSVGVQAVARVERLFTVPAGAFFPRPKVDSAVLRLMPLEAPAVADAEVARFRRMVVGLFGFRRKQLGRGVRELTGLPAEEAKARLAAAGLDESARPESLEPGEFVRLFRALGEGERGG